VLKKHQKSQLLDLPPEPEPSTPPLPDSFSSGGAASELLINASVAFTADLRTRLSKESSSEKDMVQAFVRVMCSSVKVDEYVCMEWILFFYFHCA
jgi:hypothetical protein